MILAIRQKLMLICSSLALIGLGLLCLNDNQQRLSSGIWISSQDLDLGGINQYRTKSRILRIENNTPRVIDILGIRHSCGCTSYSIDTNTLSPRGKASLQLTINAESRDGPFIVYVNVDWKDRKTGILGTIPIQIHAVSLPIFLLSRQEIDFGDLQDSQEAPIEQTLDINRGPSADKWDSIQLEAGSAKSAQLIAISSDHYKVIYSIDPRSTPVGVYKDEIHLMPKLRGAIVDAGLAIPVSARLVSNIRIVPEGVYLGEFDSIHTANGTIRLQTTDNSPIELKKVDNSNILSVKIAGEGPGFLALHYSTLSTVPPGVVSQRLRLDIYSGREQALSIPVMGFRE